MKLMKYTNGNYTPALFDNFFDRYFGGFENENTTFLPSVDVAETDKEFEIQLSVPGMNKKDFNLEVKDGHLTISGERKFEKEDKGKNYRSIESHYGNFKRSFYLPDTVDENKIQAQYKDGILTLTVPKDEKKEVKTTIEIK